MVSSWHWRWSSIWRNSFFQIDVGLMELARINHDWYMSVTNGNNGPDRNCVLEKLAFYKPQLIIGVGRHKWHRTGINGINGINRINRINEINGGIYKLNGPVGERGSPLGLHRWGRSVGSRMDQSVRIMQGLEQKLLWRPFVSLSWTCAIFTLKKMLLLFNSPFGNLRILIPPVSGILPPPPPRTLPQILVDLLIWRFDSTQDVVELSPIIRR